MDGQSVSVEQDRPRSPDPDGRLVAIGFAVTIVGGLVLAATYVAEIPASAVAVGGVLFTLGLVVAFVVGYRESRRQGRSLFAAFGRGLRTLWSWLWAFMP